MRSLIYTAILAIILTSCGDRSTDIADCAGMVDKSELEALIIENDRLERLLAYEEYRAQQAGGAELLLLQAEYYLDRGHKEKAGEMIQKVQELHGDGPHADKAAELEVRMDRGNIKEVEAFVPKDDNIESVKDKAHGVTLFYDKRIPRDPDTTSFYLYMGNKLNGAPWLRMHTQYAGDQWLYLKEVVLKSPELEWRMSLDPRLIFTSSGELYCAEWHDVPPTHSELNAIKKLIRAKDVDITFIGANRQISRSLTEAERDGIINVLEIYNSKMKIESLDAGV